MRSHDCGIILPSMYAADVAWISLDLKYLISGVQQCLLCKVGIFRTHSRNFISVLFSPLTDNELSLKNSWWKVRHCDITNTCYSHCVPSRPHFLLLYFWNKYILQAHSCTGASVHHEVRNVPFLHNSHFESGKRSTMEICTIWRMNNSRRSGFALVYKQLRNISGTKTSRQHWVG